MPKIKSLIPFKTYDIPVELTVDSLDESGVGIAFYDGYSVYIENALVGEVLEVLIGEPFANGSKRRPGTIVSYLKKSADRNDSDYAVIKNSTCPLAHMKYEATLKYKAELIKAALEKTGNSIKSVEVYPCTDEICRFKSIRYFAYENGTVVNGFYKNRSHEVEKVTACAMEPQWFSDAANALCDLFTQDEVPVYSEEKSQGLLRSLVMRDTRIARMLTVVVADNLKDDLKAKIVSALKPFNINSVYLNINKTIGNRILGDTLEKLHGLDFIDVELCGFNYKVGPKTFLQVNYPVASKLYNDAVDFVGNDENAEALDLCCGVGTMSLMLSKHFKSVTGIEVVSSSIEAAKENAAINGIDNVSFVLGDIREKIGELARIQNIKGIICDPSRVGIGEDACKTLSRIRGPVKLSYIFCSLKALERDIKTLTDSGFKIEAVKGYDMFPYTMHVETAVFLSKCN